MYAINQKVKGCDKKLSKEVKSITEECSSSIINKVAKKIPAKNVPRTSLQKQILWDHRQVRATQVVVLKSS